jgi:hypothetical protein
MNLSDSGISRWSFQTTPIPLIQSVVSLTTLLYQKRSANVPGLTCTWTLPIVAIASIATTHARHVTEEVPIIASPALTDNLSVQVHAMAALLTAKHAMEVPSPHV